jgi:hypothetical protein
MYKVGSSDFWGGGICGFGPIPASSGKRAVLPQAATVSKLVANPVLINERDEVDMEPGTAIKMPQRRRNVFPGTIAF